MTGAIQMYGVLFAVCGLGLLIVCLIVWTRFKQGEATGEISQKAKDAITDIQEAVKSGDDAKVQEALLKHLKGGL